MPTRKGRSKQTVAEFVRIRTECSRIRLRERLFQVGLTWAAPVAMVRAEFRGGYKERSGSGPEIHGAEQACRARAERTALFKEKGRSMKRILSLGGVVLLVLSGCQTDSTARPKSIGSSSQPASSGLARNTQPANTPNTTMPTNNVSSANSGFPAPGNSGFPAPGSSLSQTSGMATSPTSNVGGTNTPPRFTTPPAGIPDLGSNSRNYQNGLPADTRFPTTMPPIDNNGPAGLKGPPVTGPTPQFNAPPVSGPPPLQTTPIGNMGSGLSNPPPRSMSGPDSLGPMPGMSDPTH